MGWVYGALLVAGIWPLVRAWRRCAGTSLEHAIFWLGAAWAGWALPLLVARAEDGAWQPWRYLALCLTCCPIVAVLGARRPYVAAWNFVVLGLLCVMLLPLLEMLLLGSQTLDTLRLVFLAITLALGVVNYLPTAFGLGAACVGMALTFEFWSLASPETLPAWLDSRWAHPGLLLSPWTAWLGSLRPGGERDFNRVWLVFRDRYGVAWGQRVREQFNRAAANAGWKCWLAWTGIRGIEDGSLEEATQTLRALLKRFMHE